MLLVWSVKSGKSKLFWNGQDITRLFRESSNKKPPPSSLEFAWQSARGTNFKVITHAIATGPANPQYEFLIDDESFFSLLRKNKAIQKIMDEAKQEASPEQPSRSERPSRLQRALSAEHSGSGGEQSGDGMSGDLQQQSLARGGFSYTFDLKDELVSDLYSSTLDFLREEVSKCVPETEDMISRAILNAFSVDHDSDTSNDSLSASSDVHVDPAEVEADALGETFEWLKWSRDFISYFDVHDRKQEFMQKHVDQMVAHVRHDRLKVSVASQIMHRVAAVLKLEVTRAPVPDTVMFGNLNSFTTPPDLLDAMRPYGDVVSASVSKDHEGFGFCRFASCGAVQLVCEAVTNGDVEINGRIPEVFELFNSPYSKDTDLQIEDPQNREYDFGLDEVDSDIDGFDQVENYNRDFLDPSDDGIEATYNAGYRRPLNPSHLGQSAYSQNSSEPSTSSYTYSPRSFKDVSTRTHNTLSTIDVDDHRANSNSFLPMRVID